MMFNVNISNSPWEIFTDSLNERRNFCFCFMQKAHKHMSHHHHQQHPQTRLRCVCVACIWHPFQAIAICMCARSRFSICENAKNTHIFLHITSEQANNRPNVGCKNKSSLYIGYLSIYSRTNECAAFWIIYFFMIIFMMIIAVSLCGGQLYAN